MVLLIGEKEAYDKALNFLDKRMYTVFELTTKLRIRKISPEVTQEVIQRLLNQDLLDDQKYAQVFLDYAKRYKSWGYFGIKAKMLQKGIPSEIIEETLANLSLEEEVALAQMVINKKSRVSRKNLILALRNRGFRTEVVNKLLSEFN